MFKRSIAALGIIALCAAGAAAQGMGEAAQEKAQGSRTPAPAKSTQPAKVDVGQPVNVKIDLSIVDQAGSQPVTKTITLIAADHESGSIRTSGWILASDGRRDAIINVDARPIIMKDGLIRVDLGLQYQPEGGSQTTGTAGRWQNSVNERVSTIVRDGQPLVISQAADPSSDRKVTVQLTATVMK